MTTLDLITRDDLERFKRELFDELKKIMVSAPPYSAKQWLKSAEVRKLLNISPGTLQNLRINGVLPYTKMGSILYYKQEDISRILNDNLA